MHLFRSLASLLTFMSFLTFAAPSLGAELSLPAGAPTGLKIQRLWGSLISDDRESAAFRFTSKSSLDVIQPQVQAWLVSGVHPVQTKSQNGWLYLSNFVNDVWLTVQLRAVDSSNSLEGLITVWRALPVKPVSMAEQLPSLRTGVVLKESLGRDQNRVSKTLVLISDQTVADLALALSTDLKRLGFERTPYSPSMLKGSPINGVRGTHTALAQAWSSAQSSVVFSVFEHSGKTALTLHWTTKVGA